MKSSLSILLALSVCFTLPVAMAQDSEEKQVFKDSKVIPDDAELTLLASEFKFTEGPTADEEGNVYFTDQPNDRILRWSTDGELTEWLKPSGRSNGLYFDGEGALLACADGNNELWSIDLETKEITVLLKEYDGKRFNGPNDVWLHPDGGIYFTDPFYRRDYWEHSEREQDGQHVYLLPEGGKEAKRVAEDLVQPNGIIGTKDGKQLFVADIRAGKTYRYDVEEDGSLSGKTLFCEEGSDGMTLDDAGNLYLTGKGVLVFDRDGKQIEHIEVPENWTANVCFGGKDRQTLFITASDSLYSISTRTKGL